MAKERKIQTAKHESKEAKRITARVDISRKNSNTKIFILQLSKSAEKALSMKPQSAKRSKTGKKNAVTA